MIIVIAIVAAVAVGAAGAGVALVRTIGSAAAAKTAAGEFFSDLEGRRYDDAYQRLCADTQQQFDRPGFEARVEARPLVGHDFTGELRVNGTPSGTTGTVGVALRYSDGASDKRLVTLTRTDSQWRICGSPY
jgi:Domain of unknown function (DUF4878)